MRKAKLEAGWLKCPKCGKKFASVPYGSYGYGFVIKCARCGTYSVIEVEQENKR